jgi:hypothetical protein
LPGWYVCFSTSCSTIEVRLLALKFHVSSLTFQIMLYVDMEVNGVPLKVETVL